MKERAALYRFLAEAYLRPPDEAFLELAEEVLEPCLATELAGKFSWLFDFNVYPYASIYLDPSGMVNDPWSGFVAGVYRALGLELKSSAGLAAGDHLSAELEAVAVLLEREAGAENGVDALRARHGQQVLLFEQLLPWLPLFSHALRRADPAGFYGHIAEFTLEVALEHADEIVEDKAPAFSFTDAEDEMPVLSVSKKGAGAARAELGALITPARSGMFLSRQDIVGLARSLELPVRFAERAFMLESLVEAAADYGRLSALFSAFRRAAEEQRRVAETLQTEHPSLAPIWSDWRNKLEATVKELEALREGTGETACRL